MVSVSEKQLDFILEDITAHGIEAEDLKDDLLDHICCIVENEMNTGDDFYEFYERILPRFFTDELREIQEETDKLLTFKDYYAMKNTLVKSGLISTALTILGVIFKIMIAFIDTPFLYLIVYAFRKRFGLKIGEEIDLDDYSENLSTS